jgi:NTE family protein
MSIHVETRELLRDKALFSEFTDRDMEEFLNLLDPVEIPGGQLVVRQDEPGDCMYILVTGRAKVVHHKGGREIELAAIVPGDFFGELALVDDGPRSADVIATENCVLLKVGQNSISALAGVYPSAAFKLLIALGRIMVGRLRKSNQRYIDSMLAPISGKD